MVEIGVARARERWLQSGRGRGGLAGLCSMQPLHVDPDKGQCYCAVMEKLESPTMDEFRSSLFLVEWQEHGSRAS